MGANSCTVFIPPTDPPCHHWPQMLQGSALPHWLCTSFHGKRGKTSREKTYQQIPPGDKWREHQAHHGSGEDKLSWRVLWDKDLQPSLLPGLQKFHLWQAFGGTSLSLGHFQLYSAAVIALQRILGAAPWGNCLVGLNTQAVLLRAPVSPGSTVLPQLQALNSLWENQKPPYSSGFWAKCRRK